MGSRNRKKNKGKERKAKKEAERVEAERLEAHEVWWGWVGNTSTCDHGCTSILSKDLDHPVSRFMDDFVAQGVSEYGFMSVDSFLDRLQTVQGETILNNESYKKMAIDILTKIGVNMLLLNNDVQHGVIGALRMAKSIVVLENYVDIGTCSLQWTVASRVVASKMRDFKEKMIDNEFVIDFNSGRRDGLKFFSKRISCLCLKKMHQEARKTITKTGMCQNCKEHRIERVKLSVCSRCMVTQYCSRECQVADHSRHELECGVLVSAHQQQYSINTVSAEGT